MPAGFKLVNGTGHSKADGFWEIMEVAYGATTDWSVRLLLERRGEEVVLTCDDPTSYRVTDEFDLGDYWQARSREGAPLGTLYTIDESSFLEEIKAQSSFAADLMHYLVVGENACVELITRFRPILPTGWG